LSDKQIIWNWQLKTYTVYKFIRMVKMVNSIDWVFNTQAQMHGRK